MTIRKLLLALLVLLPSTALAEFNVDVGDVSFKPQFVAIASSDHVTEKIDVSTATCYLSKNGATPVACQGTVAEVASTDTNMPGEWVYTFHVNDVDTVGSLVLRFAATGMDPVRTSGQVGGIGIRSINTGAIQEGDFAPTGTFQVGSSTTALILAAGEINVRPGQEICVTDGAAAKQCTVTISYNNTTKTATVSPALADIPGNGDHYFIGGQQTAPSVVGSVGSIATGGIVAASFGTGAITATSIAADAIGATQIASGAIANNEIANGAITSGKFGTAAIDAAAVSPDLKGATYNYLTDSLEQIRDNLATSGTLAAGAIDASTLTAAAANKIADHLLRRNTSNVEASANGDTVVYKSLYGAVSQQTHPTTVAAGVLTIKKSDGTTTLQTRNVASSSGAAPITGLD